MKTESPGVDATTALLQRFEPVIRSTTGDKFYPMDVEPYVRACSLWVQRPGEEAVCVVPGGKLSLDRLAQQTMDEAVDEMPPERIPSADAIARDFQRFLRQRGPEQQ